MNKKEMFEIVLCVVLVVLMIVYSIYVILDEQEKTKYYKKTFYYVTDWGKYNKMVQRQRKIITKKKVQLYLLKVLVFMKEVFIWKDWHQYKLFC